MRALSSWLQGHSRGATPAPYGYDAANQEYTLVSVLRMVAPFCRRCMQRSSGLIRPLGICVQAQALQLNVIEDNPY
jgi:hypothetical protein